jgi:hypothetical protein
MANLAPDDDSAGATEPIDPTMPDPPIHGQVHVSAAHNDPKTLHKQLRDHLADHVANINATKAYHGGQIPYAPGDTGQSSQGGFRGSGMQGGASGSADYQTTGDTTGDADSSDGDASGY